MKEHVDLLIRLQVWLRLMVNRLMLADDRRVGSEERRIGEHRVSSKEEI